MIKHLLLGACTLMTAQAIAQTPQIGEVEHLKLPALQSDRVIDTLDQYVLRATGAVLTGSADGGYVCGTAWFDNMGQFIPIADAVGMHYDGVTGASVTEVLVWFGALEVTGANDNVTATVYSVNADSSANASLGSATLSTSAITASTSFTLTSFMLGTPAATGGNDFLCAVEFAGNDDTLGIVTSDPGAGDGAGENRFRLLTSASFGGAWTGVASVWGAFDCDAFIMPVVDIVAGVDAYSNGLSVKRVYPNPAIDQASIEFNLDEASDVSVRVFNLLGEELYTESTSRNAGSQLIRLNTSEFAAGNYYVTINTGQTKLTSKFVVQ